MTRRKVRGFRPSLDPLEGRVVLSSSPVAGATQAATAHFSIAGLPVLSEASFGRAMRAIDWAFADYSGQHQNLTGAVNALANYASNLVSTALTPSGTTPDPTASNTNSDVIPDGRGDGVALEARLRRAVDQLPFGNARLAPLIVQNWHDGGLSTQTASLYRDRLKVMVRHSLSEGLQSGLFTWDGIAPHHRAPIAR